jgi:hypothetical protein
MGPPGRAAAAIDGAESRWVPFWNCVPLTGTQLLAHDGGAVP